VSIQRRERTGGELLWRVGQDYQSNIRFNQCADRAVQKHSEPMLISSGIPRLHEVRTQRVQDRSIPFREIDVAPAGHDRHDVRVKRAQGD
jgi:hypothetical protein